MTSPHKNTTRGKAAGDIDEQMLPPDWMMFPALNEAWTQSAEATIALMAERSKVYQALATSAPSAERARARLIAQSYAQVHAVLRELHSTSQNSASPEATNI
jgi:hypothetical protein